MSPTDPRVTALASAIVAILDAIAETHPKDPDELVPLTAEALAARGLEHRPIVRLVEAGKLRTVRIGRRRFVRNSWLIQLADSLSTASPQARTRPLRGAGIESKDELLDVVKRMATRRAQRRGTPVKPTSGR